MCYNSSLAGVMEIHEPYEIKQRRRIFYCWVKLTAFCYTNLAEVALFIFVLPALCNILIKKYLRTFCNILSFWTTEEIFSAVEFAPHFKDHNCSCYKMLVEQLFWVSHTPVGWGGEVMGFVKLRNCFYGSILWMFICMLVAGTASMVFLSIWGLGLEILKSCFANVTINIFSI